MILQEKNGNFVAVVVSVVVPVVVAATVAFSKELKIESKWVLQIEREGKVSSCKEVSKTNKCRDIRLHNFSCLHFFNKKDSFYFSFFSLWGSRHTNYFYIRYCGKNIKSHFN